MSLFLFRYMISYINNWISSSLLCFNQLIFHSGITARVVSSVYLNILEIVWFDIRPYNNQMIVQKIRYFVSRLWKNMNFDKNSEFHPLAAEKYVSQILRNSSKKKKKSFVKWLQKNSWILAKYCGREKKKKLLWNDCWKREIKNLCNLQWVMGKIIYVLQQSQKEIAIFTNRLRDKNRECPQTAEKIFNFIKGHRNKWWFSSFGCGKNHWKFCQKNA